MKLSELIKGAPDIEIKSLMSDSREKKPESIFFCSEGLVFDGHSFIDQAIENGAICIVYEKPLNNYRPDIVYIQVESAIDALNQVANKFYGYPVNNITTFGVTGTNGKSTIAYSIKHILNKFEKCGYIGTISIEYPGVVKETNFTTPTVVELLSSLKEMVNAGCKSVAIEATSQGLHQGRVKSIDFDYVIFTNLSHDHLDYHGNMENYFQAKLELFKNDQKEKVAIVNTDNEYGLRIVKEVKYPCVTYGVFNEATYMAKDIELFSNLTKFNLEYRGDKYPVEINLVAMFNVYNILGVIASVHQSGISIEDAIKSLKDLYPMGGRMHQISKGINFTIIVDFAHTPDGFTQVFDFTRAVTAEDKKIIAVFGSAGSRDKAKRPILGHIASKTADRIILTEDDQRNEKITDICEEIASGIEETPYIIIENRYDAIEQAMELANAGDTILILGKGSQEFLYRYDRKDEYLGDIKVVEELIRKRNENA